MSESKAAKAEVVEEAVESTEMTLNEPSAQDLALMDEEMAAATAEMQAGLKVTSSKISNKNKHFTLPDGTLIGPVMEVVILGYVRANAFYAGQYDPANPTGPTCSAVCAPGGEADMAPDKKVEKQESPTCAECPNEAWGSAPVGKGKACKNEYQVAVIVPGFTTTPVTLCIAATGLKSFDSSLGGIMKAYGHPAKAIVSAEFTDAAYPVVKITGTNSRLNPDALEHFRAAKDAVAALLGD
jgi:hypothetical protein